VDHLPYCLLQPTAAVTLREVVLGVLERAEMVVELAVVGEEGVALVVAVPLVMLGVVGMVRMTMVLV
jgi:hypothetical protein